MHLIATFVALIILIIGVTASQLKDKPVEVIPSPDEQVLSEEFDVSESPTSSPDPTEEVTLSPTITALPTKGVSLQDQALIKTYIYPGATVLNEEEDILLLESEENVDVITDWYKNKIQNSGMNIKTFVQTKANDNFLNKLVGAKENFEIAVEIEKNPTDVKTSIKVMLKS